MTIRSLGESIQVEITLFTPLSHFINNVHKNWQGQIDIQMAEMYNAKSHFGRYLNDLRSWNLNAGKLNAI